ncbi:MAG: hypothetical protein PUD75_09365 [Prevotella sp.]|nr:hypothetical protein [Prevotella sp.]
MLTFIWLPSTIEMPGTYVAITSWRHLAPLASIISSVMRVTGTGASSMLSACCEAVVMVAVLPLFIFSIISAKRRGSERVGE